MKKTITKLILSTFALSLLFTSCLGDSDSLSTAENATAYVKENNAGKYVLTADGYAMTSEAIKSLDKGYFYKISYRINLANQTNNIIQAEYADVSGVRKPFGGTPTLLLTATKPTHGMAVINFALNLPDAATNFDNKWIFSYEAVLDPGEELVANFVFDSSNQKDEPEKGSEEGAEINKIQNQAVIDVVFEKKAVGVITGKPEKRPGFVVVDLTPLRNYSRLFEKKDSSIEFLERVVLGMKLRYMKDEEKKGVEPILYYDGKWGEKDAYLPNYYMLDMSKEK